MDEQQPVPIVMSDKSSRKRWVSLIAVLVVVAVIVTGGVTLTLKEANRQASAASVAAGHLVIAANGVTPNVLQIKKDQAVMWTNDDTAPHVIALSGNPLPGFGNGTRLAQGQNYSYVFDKIGTFYYYDTLNPLAVSGEVVVKD